MEIGQGKVFTSSCAYMNGIKDNNNNNNNNNNKHNCA
jgi:hypothetical protein